MQRSWTFLSSQWTWVGVCDAPHQSPSHCGRPGVCTRAVVDCWQSTRWAMGLGRPRLSSRYTYCCFLLHGCLVWFSRLIFSDSELLNRQLHAKIVNVSEFSMDTVLAIMWWMFNAVLCYVKKTLRYSLRWHLCQFRHFYAFYDYTIMTIITIMMTQRIHYNSNYQKCLIACTFHCYCNVILLQVARREYCTECSLRLCTFVRQWRMIAQIDRLKPMIHEARKNGPSRVETGRVSLA